MIILPSERARDMLLEALNQASVQGRENRAFVAHLELEVETAVVVEDTAALLRGMGAAQSPELAALVAAAGEAIPPT